MLWLPKSFVEREQQSRATQQPFVYLRVYLGWHELFSAKPSWEDVYERLRQYTLAQVLGALGRVSAILDQFDRKFAQGQKVICDGLFGERSPKVWKAVVEWIRKDKAGGGPQTEPALFHDLQLISCAKAAFRSIDPGKLEEFESFEPLAEALLMINSLQDSVVGSNPGIDPNTLEGQRIWHQHFIANGLFHHGETEVHALPRFYDLYLTDKPHLREHPSYVDLPQRIRDLTGLDPDMLWFVLFALMAHWRNIEPDSIAQGVWIMDRTEYFRTMTFSKDDIDNFFRIVSLNADQMTEQVFRFYRDELKPFHILPFARFPLVTMADKVFCVSVKLLKQKLTNGIHHLFLDVSRFSEGERKSYLDYMGAVFEDYVRRLLDRAFPPMSNRVLYPEDLISLIGSGKSCDFAILYGDSIVLLETKATRFSLAARTEGSWQEYERQFNDIFIEGGAQISSTIEAIEGGKLLELGVDPRRIQHYFPVIVTLEDLPMNGMIYKKVRDDLFQKRFLQHPKTRPLQAIDVGDLEFLEIGLNSGSNLRDILYDKTLSPNSRDDSMGNYLIAKQEPFIMGPVNDYLGKLFTEMGDRALNTFKVKRLGGQE